MRKTSIYINKYINIMENRKPNGYWNYERCKKEALKYNSRNELKKECDRAYRVIIKNKWQDSLFSHMKKLNYWEYESCKEEALKYETKNELRYNKVSVYNMIYKNKWYELFNHMISKVKPRGYWTYEKCKKEALKYKTKNELRKNNSSVYTYIHKNKWYELFEHMEIIGNKYRRLVYAYEFREDNHCYVGLTGNSKRRYLQHTNIEKTSPVFKHMDKTGLKPICILKSDYIDIKKSIVLEEDIVEEYKNNGWNILNKAKTGGVGGGIRKWTYEKCKEMALICKTKSEFIKMSGSAYNSSRKNKWLNSICKHMRTINPDGFWEIKENCKNLSLNCKNRTEFKKKSNLGYESSRSNKWLDEFFPKKSSLQVLP